MTDIIPQLFISNATAIEGSDLNLENYTYLEFKVTLDRASTEEISVVMKTSNFIPESYYTTFSSNIYSSFVPAHNTNFADSSDLDLDNRQTLVFAPGETEKTFRVAVNPDLDNENNEYVYALLDGLQGNVEIGDSVGIGTIFNDDSSSNPRIFISDTQVIEGNDNNASNYLEFDLKLDKPATTTTVITADIHTSLPSGYNYVANDAIDSSDLANQYVYGTKYIAFAPGETEKTLLLEVNSDSEVENNEEVYVEINSYYGNVTVGDGLGVGTIINDDFAVESLESNQSLALDGTGGIDIEDLALSGDFTIETWVKFDKDSTITNHNGLLAAGNYRNGNDINFYQGNIRLYTSSHHDVIVANHQSQADVWTHYAIVRENGIMKVYVDGKLDATQTTDWSETLRIDEIGNGIAAGGLDGELDEFRIWSVARSSEEINTNKGVSINPTASGLERYYQFDGGIVDVTGNSSEITVPDHSQLFQAQLPETTTSSNSSATNQSLVLDGTGGIDIEDLVLSGDFTVEAWVKFAEDSEITNHDGLVASGNTYKGGNDINFYQGKARIFSDDYELGKDPVVANRDSVTGQWTHYAVVRENGVAKVYVDGVLDATSPSNYNWDDNFAIAEIGSGIARGGLYGELDEFRIWSVARSEEEININKKVSIEPTTSGLESYYQFDNGIIDVTGNSNEVAVPYYAQLVTNDLTII
ncbi:MAG: hypothetical protein Tsb0014_20390 [Pleurocapsa sp.]